MKPPIDPNNMTISASQLDDFLDCPRRWWLKKVAHLPELQRDYFTFGTVLHSCVERWMAADEQGRVPLDLPSAYRLDTRTAVVAEGPLADQVPGEPVNVFPKGWETAEGRGAAATVTPNEARHIRALFEDAVEKGILIRSRDVMIERQVDLPVVPGVMMTGFLDWYVPRRVESIPEIHDHKSFGESSVRYLKQPGPTDEGGNPVPIEEPFAKDDGTSPNSVGHNQQLLTYSAATSILDKYDGPVLVRHNQFPKFKDSKGVRKVQAIISPKRIRAHWAFVQETALRMQKVAQVKKWVDTPGPESLDSCGRYGGCPFQGICGKRETLEGYTSRVEGQTKQKNARGRLNLPLESKKSKKGNGGNDMDMDIFKKARENKPAVLAAAKEKAQATAPAPTSAPAAESTPTAAPAPAPAVNSGPVAASVSVVGGAPWASPTCPSCKGLGMNKQGRPCMICDKVAAKNNRPTSGMYHVEITAEGATAVARDDQQEAIAALGAELQWAQSDAKVTEVAKAAPVAVAVVAKPAATPKPVAAPVAAPVVPAPVVPAPVAAEPSPTEQTEAPEEQISDEAATEVPAAEEKPAKRKTGSGRPIVGITLMLGVVQLQGTNRPTVLAPALLEKIGAEMAKDMNAESYWALDPQKRKDRLKQRGAIIAEQLGRTVVVFPGGANDFDLIALFNALEPHAETVLARMN